MLTSIIIENCMIRLSDYQYNHTIIILWAQYWKNRHIFAKSIALNLENDLVLVNTSTFRVTISEEFINMDTL